MLLILACVVRKHRMLAAREGQKGQFFAKVFLENIWRRIPFVDTKGYSRFLAECGIPVIQNVNAMVPPGTEPGSLMLLEQREIDLSNALDMDSMMEDILPVYFCVVNALGLPIAKVSKTGEDLLEATLRAMEKQPSLSLPD